MFTEGDSVSTVVIRAISLCSSIIVGAGVGLTGAQAASASNGSWAGTWSSGGTTMPAHLNLTHDDPIDGIIDVGMCTAYWSQSQVISPSVRTVRASVISGPCNDNVWTLTITPGLMSGSDGRGSTIVLSPMG
jgi:hypothetical protein